MISLVKQMMELPRQLATTQTSYEKTALQQQIEGYGWADRHGPPVRS